MKPVRCKLRGVPKTPHKSPTGDEDNLKEHDPVEVFCRLKPLKDETESSCISLLSSSALMLSSPCVSKVRKAVQINFNHIFTEHASQKEIFDHIAKPLLQGLLCGVNGLLFAYGVTGSGKTFTMSGKTENPGITPRCINMLFNTIEQYQTPKFLVKSDKLNGFEIQSESDALNECMFEVKQKRKTFKRQPSDGITQFMNDGVRLPDLNENLRYTVFVSYVEIYNNTAYDLLDDAGTKTLQSKILREDSNHNIYVNGVVEIEVKSAEEALELYNLGKKRKRMAQTSLNTESSRSHSIFIIRLVASPVDIGNITKNRQNFIVSQLSLVDLAGSERCSRTQTTGQRLKEAGSINNSLMSLRACLQILRENQQSGLTRSIVPYRDSRLTHLFKNFFEGEGKVKMIVCINPSMRDYDETLHVLKFAEITQEVKILRPEYKLPEMEEIKPSAVSVMVQTEPTIFTSAYIRGEQKTPKVRLITSDSDEIKSLIIYLKKRKEHRTNMSEILGLSDRCRERLLRLEKINDQYHHVKYLLSIESKKVKELKKTLLDREYRHDKAMEKCAEKEKIIENLQSSVAEKNFKIRQNVLKKAKHEKEVEQLSEKMTHELDAKLRRQREYLANVLKEKDSKIELAKDILSDNNRGLDVTHSLIPSSVEKSDEHENVEPEQNYEPRREKIVANVRYRRSRSAGDRWLEHRPAQPVPLGTVLQPMFHCRKSVTKLTNMKDVVNPKQGKYLLISQNQDDVGDLETRLYKGDIIPTCSGGAQVIFDDVEKLKQESPTAGTKSVQRRRPFPDTEEKCSFAVEGHVKKQKK